MPRTPIAVVTGDNHLRPTIWSKHPDLRGDAYVSFSQIVDYCIEHRLPLILLGDTFDKRHPDSESVTFFSIQMGRMQRAGHPVYYIQGNHDQSDPPWPEVHDHCRHVDGVIDLPGFKTFGLDYHSHDNLPDVLAAIPADVQIVLAHQSWLEIQRVGHVDGSFSMFPRATTLLTGDYHVHASYEGTAADGGKVVAYSPGSTCMQALNEQQEKFIYILNREDNGGVAMLVHQLLTRPIARHTCRDEAEFGQMINAVTPGPPAELTAVLPDEISKPILQVRFNDSIPEAFERLEAAAGDRWHLFSEPQRGEVEDLVIDANATPEGAFDSLISAVGELCTPGTDLYNGVRRLLEAEDPRAEMHSMFEDWKQRHEQTQPGQDPPGVPTGAVGGGET